MPYAPAKPCIQPMCPNLQPCPTHHAQPVTLYGGRHRQWRAMVLGRYPICQAPGCTLPSTDADHITSVRLRPDLQYEVSNGIGLCHAHHSSKTVRVDGGFG